MLSGRDVDVAYVLEDVPGVLGVFVVRDVPGIEYAIRVADAYSMTTAHYALLRVLTHAECTRVEHYRFELPALVRAKGTQLFLSASEREDARARVPLTTAALEQHWPGDGAAPPPKPDQLSVLVVDDDPAVEQAAIVAFGDMCRLVVTGDPLLATWKAKAHSFALVLCDVNRAFGDHGVVSNLALADHRSARRVVLLALPRAKSTLEDAWFTNELLRKPLSIASLRAALWRSAAPPTPLETPRSPRPLQRRRVLVIDEKVEQVSNDRFTMTIARDAWSALDLVHEDWALVVCSLTMKTEDGARLYSLMCRARPDLKRRFALLVDRPDSSNRVLTRPLQARAISEMLERVDEATRGAAS